MTPDTFVTLGDITFQNFEVPEQMPFGGVQRLSIHDMPGGNRKIDAMGAFPGPKTWGGRFRGQNALVRAKYVDGLRASGNQVLLTWSEFQYIGVVREFDANFERFYEIPYRLTFEVAIDASTTVSELPQDSADSLINADMNTSSGLLSQLGIPSLTSAFASVQSAVSAVSSFATAAQSELNSVLQPLQQFRMAVETQIANVNNTLVNVTTLGGILPNNPLAQNVQKLTNTLTAAEQIPLLINLDRTTGRVGTNITSLYSSAKQVTVAGANLMQMAAKEYGDFTAWTGIAKANPQLKGDPIVSGVQTIIVPPSADPSGGILKS